ncbi:MAG: protein-(glutamine-N5) methyltransferase, release factor-specific [Legionellales bacterium]|nr:protein-(glutamine-N5) methyltransferase, release factor-specific [Legionellales bacterium]
MLTLEQVAKDLQEKLSDFEDPRFEANQLLSHVLDKSLAIIIAYPDVAVTKEQVLRLQTLASKRKNGVPLAYLLHEKGFYDLTFMVNEDTLIPRPETERIVERVLEYRNDKLDFLDIGTGAGAIALSVANQRPGWSVTATDICERALGVAKINAEKNSIKNITFLKSDLFSTLGGLSFDIIASNPPYIDLNDPEVETDVRRYEPNKALFSPNEGLWHLTQIIVQSKQYLKPNAMLILEHGYQQDEHVRKLLSEHGYLNPTTIADYAGKPRATYGLWAGRKK